MAKMEVEIDVDINVALGQTGGTKKGDIHVVPVIEGKREHVTNPDCWCRPKKTFTYKPTGHSVWSHFINKSKRKGK